MAHFADGFEVDLLILKELNGENQAKSRKFFYLTISPARLVELTELGEAAARLWIRNFAGEFAYNYKDSERREIIGKLGEEMLSNGLNDLR